MTSEPRPLWPWMIHLSAESRGHKTVLPLHSARVCVDDLFLADRLASLSDKAFRTGTPQNELSSVSLMHQFYPPTPPNAIKNNITTATAPISNTRNIATHEMKNGSPLAELVIPAPNGHSFIEQIMRLIVTSNRTDKSAQFLISRDIELIDADPITAPVVVLDEHTGVETTTQTQTQRLWSHQKTAAHYAHNSFIVSDSMVAVPHTPATAISQILNTSDPHVAQQFVLLTQRKANYASEGSLLPLEGPSIIGIKMSNGLRGKCTATVYERVSLTTTTAPGSATTPSSSSSSSSSSDPTAHAFTPKTESRIDALGTFEIHQNNSSKEVSGHFGAVHAMIHESDDSYLIGTFRSRIAETSTTAPPTHFYLGDHGMSLQPTDRVDTTSIKFSSRDPSQPLMTKILESNRTNDSCKTVLYHYTSVKFIPTKESRILADTPAPKSKPATVIETNAITCVGLKETWTETTSPTIRNGMFLDLENTKQTEWREFTQTDNNTERSHFHYGLGPVQGKFIDGAVVCNIREKTWLSQDLWTDTITKETTVSPSEPIRQRMPVNNPNWNIVHNSDTGKLTASTILSTNRGTTETVQQFRQADQDEGFLVSSTETEKSKLLGPGLQCLLACISGKLMRWTSSRISGRRMRQESQPRALAKLIVDCMESYAYGMCSNLARVSRLKAASLVGVGTLIANTTHHLLDARHRNMKEFVVSTLLALVQVAIPVLLGPHRSASVVAVIMNACHPLVMSWIRGESWTLKMLIGTIPRLMAPICHAKCTESMNSEFPSLLGQVLAAVVPSATVSFFQALVENIAS